MAARPARDTSPSTRLEQKPRLIADEIRPAQDPDLPPGDGQLLLRLPEGALFRRLPGLRPVPRGSTPLPAGGGGPQSGPQRAVPALALPPSAGRGQRSCTGPPGVPVHGRRIARRSRVQIPHSSILSARCRLQISTVGSLGGELPVQGPGQGLPPSPTEGWRRGANHPSRGCRTAGSAPPAPGSAGPRQSWDCGPAASRTSRRPVPPAPGPASSVRRMEVELHTAPKR